MHRVHFWCIKFSVLHMIGALLRHSDQFLMSGCSEIIGRLRHILFSPVDNASLRQFPPFVGGVEPTLARGGRSVIFSDWRDALRIVEIAQLQSLCNSTSEVK